MSRNKQTTDIVGAMVAVLVCAAAAHGQQPQGIQASYALAGGGYTVHEPVYVSFTVENRLAHRVRFGEVASDGVGFFRMRLTRPDGRVESAPNPCSGYATQLSKVEPSGSLSLAILLNTSFDLDTPGRYILEIGTIPDTQHEDGLPDPTRGVVVIDVGPRDPERLTRICADLEDKILRPVPGADSGGGALEYIRDPIAVPFLARVLDAMENRDGPLVIRALERIGDASAVQVIIPRIFSKDEDTASTARSALGRIAEGGADPLARAAAAAALK